MPRKSVAAKKMTNTHRKDRDNAAAPQLECAPVPPPPKDLSTEERSTWLSLAAQVDMLGVYTPVAADAFRLLVRSVTLAMSPSQATALRWMPVAMKWVARFGLDPVSSEVVSSRRAKPTDTPEDEFADEGFTLSPRDARLVGKA